MYFKLGLISLGNCGSGVEDSTGILSHTQLFFKDKVNSLFLTRYVPHLGKKILLLHKVRNR